MPRGTLHVADLFAGAGGASTGLQLAAADAGLELDLVAVNHWPAAVRTHAANHPTSRHMCEAMERVDPRDAVPGGHLHLLLAGPECTFFSTARGGRPVDDQRRSSAWTILRWLELLRVDHVLIENVPEFQAWGPIGANNKPLKSKRGQIFKAFIAAIEALGYRVEFRILNAADFGEATTRRRLFVQAVRGRGPIVWPEPTHSRRGADTLLRHTRTWRPAREVIDWSLPSESIFTRKRPLSRNTLRRIQAGLDRFGGGAFVLGQQGGAAPRSTEDPLPTVATAGYITCCEPFVVSNNTNNVPRSTADPLATITSANRLYLAEPFLVSVSHGDNPEGSGRGNGGRVRSVDEPVPTVTGSGRDYGLVEPQPFLVQVTHGGRERSIDEPLPTVTGGQRGDIGIAEPFLVSLSGTEDSHISASAKSVDDPLLTVRARGNHHALVEPFLSSYYGHGANVPVSQPVPTITTKDRFALVIPAGMDVRFRMLQPHELAAAMGFPADYVFKGTKTETVQMIGNAWSVRKARALCSAILGRWAPARPHLVEEAAS